MGTAHDDNVGFDRWLFLDTVSDTTFGIPGETTSYRHQRSELLFEGGDINVYDDIYVSISEQGDLGITAFFFAGTWWYPDTLAVSLCNPVTVGDVQLLSDVGGVEGLAARYTVVSVTDTLHLALGDFEDCARYRFEAFYLDSLVEIREEVWIPTSYWPICGLGALSGTQFTYDPYSERHYQARLIGCTVQEPVAAPPNTPAPISLRQNQSNPFNPRTTIAYAVDNPGHVRLDIFDLRGRLVETLVDEVMPAGHREVVWNGRDANGREVPSGVYLSRLEVGGRMAHGRLSLIR